MAMKESTLELYQSKASMFGATIVSEATKQSLLIRMSCGHERIFPLSTLIQYGKLTCKVCAAKEKIALLEHEIERLSLVTNA
jgi:hypothetical protein